MTTLERSPCGTVCVVGSIFSSKPSASMIGDDALARDEAVEPTIGLGRVVVDLCVVVEHVDLFQIVPLADLEIIEVVRGRDLDRARALLRVGVFVGNDRG